MFVMGTVSVKHNSRPCHTALRGLFSLITSGRHGGKVALPLLLLNSLPWACFIHTHHVLRSGRVDGRGAAWVVVPQDVPPWSIRSIGTPLVRYTVLVHVSRVTVVVTESLSYTVTVKGGGNVKSDGSW